MLIIREPLNKSAHVDLNGITAARANRLFRKGTCGAAVKRLGTLGNHGLHLVPEGTVNDRLMGVFYAIPFALRAGLVYLGFIRDAAIVVSFLARSIHSVKRQLKRPFEKGGHWRAHLNGIL